MCAWGFAGALGSSAIGAIASNASSKKQYKYQSALQAQAAKLNYEYGLKSLENSPTSERKGLETAGYNPMLAVQNATSGANSGWTSTGQAQNVDYSQAISNAFNFKRLENESKTAESTANLQNEQAITEESKRENLNFDSMMKDAERHLKDKETSWYDREANAEIYRNMQEAERARGEASVIAYNAETNRIIADAQKQQASTQKDYVDNHTPSGRSQSFKNYTSGVHDLASSVSDFMPWKRGKNYDYDDTTRIVSDKNETYIRRQHRKKK